MRNVLAAIDGDGHITEPTDLWERYIDPAYRDTCPKIFIEPDGRERFRVDEKYMLETKVEHLKQGISNSVSFGLRDGSGHWDHSYLEGEQGGFEPHARIKWMDKEAFDGTTLFPTMGLTAMMFIEEPKRAAAVTAAYNRFLVDFCNAYPDRLFGIALLPLQSVPDTIEQVKAAKKAGLRAGCVRPNPIDGRPLHHPDFYPVWEICQDLDFGVGVHGTAAPGNMGYDRFGGGFKRGSAALHKLADDKGSYAVEHCFTHVAEMMSAVTSFVLAGICDKFPRLRVAFIEAGGAWLPGYVDRMDRHFDDIGSNDTGLTMRPSEIFRRQCFCSFEPVESCISVLAEHFGANKLMVATDYPHADGFPQTLKLVKSMKLKPAVEAALLSAGAKEWLSLH